MRSNPSIGQWVVTYFTCYSTPWGAQLQRGDPVGPPVGRRESPTWRSEATARSIEGGGTTLTATDVANWVSGTPIGAVGGPTTARHGEFHHRTGRAGRLCDSPRGPRGFVCYRLPPRWTNALRRTNRSWSPLQRAAPHDGHGEGLELPGGFQYADDTADLTLQGATQWDALSHVFYDGQMFNGFSSSLITSEGAGANSIDKMRNGVVSRGVLLDIARHQELPWLPDGTAILPDELDECALAQGLEIRPGDVVLIRTGRVGRALEEGWTESFVFGPNPGLSVHCAGWLHDSMIAAVGVDNVGVEVQPGEVDDCMMPLHMIALRNIGLTFGEIFNLELLGDACASLGRFEFLFTAPPLPILGAVGSPINPLAIL